MTKRHMNVVISAMAAMCVTATAWCGGSPSCTGAWEVIETPAPYFGNAIIRDMAVISPTDIWAVGDYWTNNNEAFAMHFDGESWSVVPVPLTNELGSSGLWAVAAKDGEVWAAGYRQYTPPIQFAGFGMHIFVVKWNGSQWVAMNTPHLGGGSGDHILDIEIVGPNDVWFFGEGHPVAVQSQPSLAMRWDGSNFTVTDTPIANPQVSGFGNGNSLWGASALGPNEIWAVGAAGDGDSLPCQRSQIIRWNGSQWQHLPAAPLNCYWHSLYAVAAVSSNDVWAGGEYQDAGGYHGLALHYDGHQWSEVAVPGGIRDFHVIAPDDIYAAGSSIMHWNGTQWSVVESFPNVYGPSLTAIQGTECEMFTAGRLLEASSILPMFARFNPAPAPRTGDINVDGVVNVQDLLMVISAWGSCTANCPSDIAPIGKHDGVVNVQDLLLVITNWG